MLVEDGKGTKGRLEITEGHEMMVITTSEINKAALRGDAYAWNGINSNIDTTDCMLMVRNLSPDRLLVINRIYAWVDVAAAVDIHIGTSATAFAAGGVGAAVVGVNLNTSSAKVADAGAYSDDDDVGQGTIITTLHTNELATDQFGIDYMADDEVVLGTNGYIGADCIGEPGGFECTIIGYFVDR